jgi:hemoglobin-like flavoprotein
MTPDQKRLVQETWTHVVPIADAAADLFYRRLFEIDPSTCELFGATDMPAQRKKLLQMLAVAVRGLDDLDALTSTLEELGRRHVGYGVTDAHYDSVGAALLWTLEEGLGDAWIPAVAAAWTEAYVLMSGIMRSAAERKPSAQTKRMASIPDQAAGL